MDDEPNEHMDMEVDAVEVMHVHLENESEDNESNAEED